MMTPNQQQAATVSSVNNKISLGSNGPSPRGHVVVVVSDLVSSYFMLLAAGNNEWLDRKL